MSFDGYFQIGEVNFPLPLSSSLIEVTDPALKAILDFLEQSLNYHVLNRWNQEVNALNIPLENKLIKESFCFDVLPYLLTYQFDFPLLCIYRESEQIKDITSSWFAVESQVKILFALPPLSSHAAAKLEPFRGAIAKVITNQLLRPGDSLLNKGIMQIKVESVDYGNLVGKTNNSEEAFFPSVLISLFLSERNQLSLENHPLLEGAEDQVDLKDCEGEI